MASQFTYAILAGAQETAGSIKFWAQHSELAVDQIIEEAQRWIFARLRVREMRMVTPISIGEDEYTHALPDGFQDPIGLRLYGDSEDLDYVQENLLSRQYDDDGELQSGRPSRWAIFDELMQFDVPSDETIGGQLVFYGTPDLISSGNQENFLSTRYPTVLRRALLAFASEQRKREDFLAELKLAENEILQVNMTDDMGRRGQLLR